VFFFVFFSFLFKVDMGTLPPPLQKKRSRSRSRRRRSRKSSNKEEEEHKRLKGRCNDIRECWSEKRDKNTRVFFFFFLF